MTAKTITSAVNACYFGLRNVACTKRQSCRNDPIRNGARINGKLSHTAAWHSHDLTRDHLIPVIHGKELHGVLA